MVLWCEPAIYSLLYTLFARKCHSFSMGYYKFHPFWHFRIKNWGCLIRSTRTVVIYGIRSEKKRTDEIWNRIRKVGVPPPSHPVERSSCFQSHHSQSQGAILLLALPSTYLSSTGTFESARQIQRLSAPRRPCPWLPRAQIDPSASWIDPSFAAW